MFTYLLSHRKYKKYFSLYNEASSHASFLFCMALAILSDNNLSNMSWIIFFFFLALIHLHVVRIVNWGCSLLSLMLPVICIFFFSYFASKEINCLIFIVLSNSLLLSILSEIYSFAILFFQRILNKYYSFFVSIHFFILKVHVLKP